MIFRLNLSAIEVLNLCSMKSNVKNNRPANSEAPKANPGNHDDNRKTLTRNLNGPGYKREEIKVAVDNR
jgi:hypothetical protein